MKVSKIAFAVASLMLAGQASAVDVYVSGASALRDSMPRLMDRFCQTNAVATPRKMYVAAVPLAALDNDRRVFSCTFHTTTTNATIGAEIPATLRGQFVRVFHSVEVGDAGTLDNLIGGSITGIVPLLYTGNANAQLNFLNIDSGTPVNLNANDTTFVGAARFSHNVQAKADSQIGLSDIEPSKFTPEFGNVPDAAAVPDEWKNFDPSVLTGTVAFLGGFGVAASQNLITAGMTNITEPQLAAVLSGNITNWSQIGGPNLAVKVCRRTPGSGTQGTFNALISHVGCGANKGGAELIAGRQADFPGVIFENPTTGNVRTCLQTGNDAGLGTVGILGLENNGSDTKYQIISFDGVKIWDTTGDTVDGKVDSIREDKIISGEYPLYVESTVQERPGLTGLQHDFYTLLSDKAGDTVFTTSLPGVVTTAAKRTTGALNAGASNFARGGDTCNPSAYQP
ncbi:MAG: substrate-binding domain-containing protein [Methylophilaceae bacterium]